MHIKEKILYSVLGLVILNFVFMFGQNFYYSRTTADILLQTPVSPSVFSSNLSQAADRQFVLLVDGKELPVSQLEFDDWIEKYTRTYSGKEEYRINQTNLENFLEIIAGQIDVPAVDAQLKFTDGKITERTPSKPGHVLNIPETVASITSALTKKNSTNQPIKSSAIIDNPRPVISSQTLSDLGIQGLLGQGESDFSGSSKARVTNIQVSSNIFNNILIKPGDEFSFTKLLGPVDAKSGYKTELVIKDNKLIPEYGGGICQVSTTLFRAAIFTGLPILERHAHSIAVNHYNPQGFDATVYPGSADLRFKNDTPAYLLIQTEISGSKLYFNIYGTDDHRQITVDGPHQYATATNGSMKATLSRTIIYANGTKKTDVFNSAYQSPALFTLVRNPLD